jgi:hypothetical protein
MIMDHKRIAHYQLNLTHCFYQATDYQKQSGLLWYERANNAAQKIADNYGLTLTQTAGIIAALSPRCKWERNLYDAQRLIKYGKNTSVGTTNINKFRALAILRGESPAEILRGPKVTAFWKTILNPNTDVVVTDTWHYRAATDTDKTPSNIPPVQHSEIAQATKNLAQELNLLPCQVQAIVWGYARGDQQPLSGMAWYDLQF